MPSPFVDLVKGYLTPQPHLEFLEQSFPKDFQATPPSFLQKVCTTSTHILSFLLPLVIVGGISKVGFEKALTYWSFSYLKPLTTACGIVGSFALPSTLLLGATCIIGITTPLTLHLADPYCKTLPFYRTLAVYNLHILCSFSNLLSRWQGSLLLESAKNCHALFPTNIYQCSSLDLFSPEGVGNGSTLWFNFLLEEVKKKPTFHPKLIKDCLLAVARQFREGAPPQATLLHKCSQGIEQHPLTAFGYKQYTPLSIMRISLLILKELLPSSLILAFDQLANWLAALKEKICGKNLRKESKSLSGNPLDAFTQLQEGTYWVGLSRHAFSYIKTKEEAFIWDINVGLIAITNQQQLLRHLKLYANFNALTLRKFTSMTIKDQLHQTLYNKLLYLWHSAL